MRSAVLLPFLGVAIGVALAVFVSSVDLRGQALPPAAGTEGAQCDMVQRCDAGLVCHGFDPFIGPGTCQTPVYCCVPQVPYVNGVCQASNTGRNTPDAVCPRNTDGSVISFTGDPTCGTRASGAGQPCGVCGDGKKDPGEACDDGNDSNDDFCSTTCTAQHLYCCNAGGNEYDRGICISSSRVDNCIEGTGIFYSWYDGDDAEIDAGLDSCITQCEVFNSNEGTGGCGDGIVFGTEECDDGNTDDDDGCSWDCEIEKERCCVQGFGAFTQCTAATTGYVPSCIGTKRYDHSNTTCDYDCDSPRRPADWCCMDGTYECRPVGN